MTDEQGIVSTLDALIGILQERRKYEGSEWIVDTGWDAVYHLAKIVQKQQLQIDMLIARTAPAAR